MAYAPTDPNKFDFNNHMARIGDSLKLSGKTSTTTVQFAHEKSGDVILNADDHAAQDAYAAKGFKLVSGTVAPRKDARDPALIASEERAAMLEKKLIELNARLETVEKKK